MTEATHPVANEEQNAGGRIAEMDAARGLALLGIFCVNIMVMVQPMGIVFTGAGNEGTALDRWVSGLSVLLFAEKSYPLFSLLFGMGIAVMWTRCVQTGRKFGPMYARRLALLVVFGLVHAFLIWFGDVLIFYAGLGLVAMWLVRLPPKLLVAGGLAFVLIGSLIAPLMLPSPEEMAMPLSQEVPENPGLSTLIEATRDPEFAGPFDPAWYSAELKVFGEGPFSEAVGLRGINWMSGLVFWFVLGGAGFKMFGMFLLGAGMVRAGIFEPGNPWLRRVALLGVFFGLPGAIVNYGLTQGNWFDGGAFRYPIAAISGLAMPAQSLLYLWIGAQIARGGGAIARAFAATGRMALTNYLMQSTVVAIIVQHWGFGLYGEISFAAGGGIVLGVFALQLALSPLWLSRFSMGPLEWLWRWGTYFKRPPLRVSRA